MLVQLQYLRAIAAVAVVYFHAILQYEKTIYFNGTTLPALGEFGVDLFFVLSGYVIWKSVQSNKYEPASFIYNRIKRIIPLYWSATLFAAAIALAFPDILKSTVFDASHTIASLFFIPWPSPISPTEIFPVIVPGWTLNYEVYFYSIVASSLLLSQKYRLAFIFSIISFGVILRLIFPSNYIISFYGSSIVLEFFYGCIIAAAPRISKLRRPWTGVGIAIATSWIIAAELYFGTSYRWLLLGVPSALIVFCLASIRTDQKIGLFKLIGDASYEIYITHVFVLAACRVVFNKFEIAIFYNQSVFTAVCVAASVVLGLVCHLALKGLLSRSAKLRVPLWRSRSGQRPG